MTEYYLFATFVFILCLGMLIVMKFVFKIDKPDNKDTSIREREAKIFRLYEQIEDMLDEFEEYAEKAKNEIKSEKEDADKVMNRISEQIEIGENTSLAFDEKRMDEIINKNLEIKLDNRVSEAVSRIVARSVKEEIDIALDDIIKRMEHLEKSGTGRIIGFDENEEKSAAEIFDFSPGEFTKPPETLEELGESIERAIKNNSKATSNMSMAEKKKKRRKAVELYKSGMNINDIAKELEITSSEIKLIIDVLD